MANIAIFRINYKSDFILTLNSDAGWMTPFCIKFWTGAPSQAYFVGYDGETYTHCAPVAGDPTKLEVQFDDHHLPIGDLKFQIGYHFTVADFPTSVEDEVINQAAVIIDQDGTPMQVMLDLNGETAPEIEFSLPAYANEAQRIANEEQRIANETQRIGNEETRIQHEESRIAAEQTRQQNEQQRINQEQARVNEFAVLKRESEQATTDANNAAENARQKAQLAQDKATLAQTAAQLANDKAQLAADKAALAQAASQLCDEKAALAQQKATYAQQQGDYSKAQGDYAKEQGDYSKAQGDYSKEQGDYSKEQGDYSKEQGDYAKDKGDICAADHQTAVADHQTATADHQTAAADHQTATTDHNQAGNDHTRAESDHNRAEIDHAAVEVYVDSLGAFDISAYHAIGGVLAKYADLTAALGTNGANIPDALRKGGMSVKFVQSIDNKYVQARCMAQNFTTDVTLWQGVDEEPAAGSKNLIESGGVYSEILDIKEKVIGLFYINNNTGTAPYKAIPYSFENGKKYGIKVSNASTNVRYLFTSSSGSSYDASLRDLNVAVMPEAQNYSVEYTCAKSGISYIWVWATSAGTTFELEISSAIVKELDEIEKHLDSLDDDVNAIEENATELQSDFDKISVKSNNILDLTGTTEGKQISVWGTEVASPTYCYTKLIPVTQGQSLFFHNCWTVAAYSGNTAQNAKGVNGAITNPYVVPEGIDGIRTNFTIAIRDSQDNYPYISVGEDAKRDRFGNLYPKTTDDIYEGNINPLSSQGAVVLKDALVTIEKSPNKLDLSKLTKGYVNSAGAIVDDDTYYSSDFISVNEGDVVYLSGCRTICAFNSQKIAVPSAASASTGDFEYTVPSGISFVRTYIVFIEASKPNYPYVTINQKCLRVAARDYVSPQRVFQRYKLHDAFAAWKNGISFPVGFIGDSTTDGTGTTGWNVDTNGHAHQDEVAGGTGKADYDCALAYPHILQNLLRAELGNTVPKIYNIGYSGAALNTWINAGLIQQVFAKENDLYCNCRMVGINLGINDRVVFTTEGEFIAGMVDNLVWCVDYLLSIGITPFMVTSQIVLQAGGLTQSLATLPQNYMQRLCNYAKIKVADMYGLEVVDMNAFDELLLRCSNYPIGGTTPDRLMDFYGNLHFADKGHELEAGYLFSQFVPYVLETDNENKIYVGLTNRNARSNEYINLAESTDDKFKMQFNGTQSSASDTLVYDAYILNNSLNGQYSVTYYTPVASGYIVIDGDTANPIAITATEIELGTWDIGLHHVQVYTGESTTVAFRGFLLEQQNI